jgi:hypothetical protein
MFQFWSLQSFGDEVIAPKCVDDSSAIQVLRSIRSKAQVGQSVQENKIRDFD